MQVEASQLAAALVGAWQAVSQSPQWFAERVRSTQLPPQFVRPAAQVSEQVPPEQTLPPEHALSQAPQCSGSLERSKQTPLQDSSGDLQVMPHTPCSQLGSPPARVGHALPHAPQLSTSERKSRHRVSQGEVPFMQAKLQFEAAQTGTPPCGAVQVAPQPPQFLGSVLSTTHLPPQTVSPSRQASLVTGRIQVLVGSSHTYPAAQRWFASHSLPSRLLERLELQARATSVHAAANQACANLRNTARSGIRNGSRRRAHSRPEHTRTPPVLPIAETWCRAPTAHPR